MKNRNLSLILLTLIIATNLIISGCNKKENQKVELDPIVQIFGNYPADYRIAYFSMLGYSPAPTVKDLFGPETTFASSFQGMPATVTLENTSGNAALH
jgi:hypothetical protein